MNTNVSSSDEQTVNEPVHQVFRFMVGKGHCPMILKYGQSLSQAVGWVQWTHPKSYLNKKYSSYRESTNSTKQKVHVGSQYSQTYLT